MIESRPRELPSITSNRQKRIKKSTTLKLEEVNAITSPYGWNSKNVNQDQPWEVVGQCLEQNQSGTFGNNFKDKNDLASPLTWRLDENKPMNPTYFSKAVGNKSTTGCLIWMGWIVKSYCGFIFGARHFPPSFLWWKNVYI